MTNKQVDNVTKIWNKENKKTTANIGLAIGGVTGFYYTFVVKQTLVF